MTYLALLLGLVVGSICTVGLYFGMKILMAVAEAPDMPSYKRRRSYFWASLILGGQFLLSLAVLYKSSLTRSAPLFVGLGLVGAIFAMTATLATWGGKPADKK